MNTPWLRFLSTEDLHRIHDAALQILERIGMLVDHAGAREMLDGEGAKVDAKTNRVRFPPDVVEAKLAQVPRRMAYHGRTEDFDFVCEPDGDLYAQVGGGSIGYIDLDSGDHRRSRLDDLREFSILGDALPNVHVAAAHMCGDVPQGTSDLHCLLVLLESQRLPISTNAFSVGNLRAMIQMLSVVRGSGHELARRPPMTLEASPISPLYLTEDDAAQVLLACEHGMPVLFPVMPNVGVTGPITLPGTIAQSMAEFFAMVVLTETARPGHPVPFFIDPVVADLRTVSAQFAAPDAGFLMAAIAQMGGELYGFPAQGNGLCSDGFSYPQTLFQKAQNMLFLALAGGKLAIGAGEVESVVSFDPVQLVIDDEIMAITRRWARRVAVNDDTLAVDVLERVGPRGQFLDDDHTVDHLRAGELFRSTLFERGNRAMWTARGAKVLIEAARDRAHHLLATHEVPPLPDDVRRELRTIVEKADAQQASGSA
jgi:trimethylamine--corrinoid protein Co-methyltransferase